MLGLIQAEMRVTQARVAVKEGIEKQVILGVCCLRSLVLMELLTLIKF